MGAAGRTGLIGPVMRSADRSGSPPFRLLDRQRRYVLDLGQIAAFLVRFTRELQPAGSFTVVLISDRAMRPYNRRYRGQDRTTDVLSFEGDDAYLGDILISADMARRQWSGSRTLAFETYIGRLALHGLLHLMGYDHETDDGEMRDLETRLRRRFRC